MIIRKAIRILGGICLFALTISSAQETDKTDSYVARAGSVFISEEEFVQRFELLPSLNRNRSKQLDNAKLELLYAMIAEKLLAQEAVDRKLDQDSLFTAAFLSVRKLLARDQLYREEISRLVTVTPAEITSELKRMQQLVHVAFLYFDREEDATFIRNRITTAADFDRLSIDSSMQGFRDTATVIWGDAEPEIEQVAYSLKPGEVSAVVPAGSGYYILRCIRIQPASIHANLSADARRERATTRVRQRKEQPLIQKFVPTILQGKSAYSRPGPFKLLARSLTTVFEEQAVLRSDSMLVFSKEMEEQVRLKCAPLLFDSLVVVGETFWTTNDIASMLLAKQFAVPRDQLKSTATRLNEQIRALVEHELIAQEALRRGLDRRAEVQTTLDVWRSAYLADMMKLYARKHVTVNEAEVWSYLQQQDSSIVLPQVNIRELRTSSLDAMNNALTDLEGGMAFEDVVKTWSNDSNVQNTKGETGFFAVNERPHIGEIAAGMQVGERYGPLRVGEDVVYFELLDKRTSTIERDSSVVARKEAAAKELLAFKNQGTLNAFIAQVARNRGVDVYTDRLQRIELSPFPMLVFRILGFGGRMFAVPFVDPQLQWLNIEPPETPVLP